MGGAKHITNDTQDYEFSTWADGAKIFDALEEFINMLNGPTKSAILADLDGVNNALANGARIIIKGDKPDEPTE